ncbi:MAG TPA: hypothetical protein VK949_00730 [Methylotenera sp.]|nr:hypothetical protein [Methylotenera sp.]
MNKNLIAFLFLSLLTITANAQILAKEQVVKGGKTYTIVLYSYKCFVEKGEGIQVKIYDAAGNLFLTACRTGGGGEEMFYTYPDGTVRHGDI